jgi:hypothetical protein
MIISTIALTTLLTKLVDKSLDKALEKTGEWISESAIKWVKNIFCKEDDTPKNEVIKFLENPESETKIALLKSMIASDVEDNPSNMKFFEEINDKLSKIDNSINISHSKNVNTGTINSGGGSIHFGDMNNEK